MEKNDVYTRVLKEKTDRKTHTDTDTQDKYCNPPVHARIGLMMIFINMTTKVEMLILALVTTQFSVCTYVEIVRKFSIHNSKGD